MNSQNRKRRVSRPHLVLGLLVLAPLAGCLNVVDNVETYNQYGAVTVRGAGGSATVSAIPSAIFFQAIGADIPDSRTIVNSCATSAVDTTTPSLRGELKGGSGLTMTSGAGATKVTTALALNPTSLAYIGPNLTYKAGDSATIFVPGEANGFPQSTVTVRLAEPIIPADITVPASGSNMVLSWNQGDGTSAVIVQIKYAFPATRTYANEQVLCSLRDDGAEEIGSNLLNSFITSPVDKRSIRFTRFRTAAYNPTTRSLLHIVSTADSTAKLK